MRTNTPANASAGSSTVPSPQPWRNGYIESFNGRLCDEYLNISIFWSLARARVAISDWKDEYNHHRRHSALGYQTPAGYAAACTHH